MAFKKVVSELLNDVSLSMANRVMEITYLPRKSIQVNEKNAYSISEIEALAQDIRMAGLEQPLVVHQTVGGIYKLLSGHRRLAAINLLISEGSWQGSIPCIVKELEEYELPLPNDLKEHYSILRTNAHNRKPTDSDIQHEMRAYKEIVLELRKNGYKELIIGYDDNGDPKTKSIKGRTREVVADMLGISTGQLSKHEKVDKKASDEVKRAVKESRVSIAVADQIADMPEEMQDEFIHLAPKDKIYPQDLKEFKDSRCGSLADASPNDRSASATRAQRKEDAITITKLGFLDLIEDIMCQLDKKPISLSVDEYRELKQHIGRLGNMLGAKEKVKLIKGGRNA